MKNQIIIVLLLFILAGMGYTIYSFFATSDGDINTVERFDQEPINLDDYIGQKKTILQFVAVPCECCSYSMPFIQEFAAEQNEIEVITIVFYGKKKEIRTKFEDEYQAKHLWGIDLDQSIANHYGVNVSPTYVFFDETGNNMGSYPYIIPNKEELQQRYDEAYQKYHGVEGS